MHGLRRIMLLLSIIFVFSISGVFATWYFFAPMESVENDNGISLNEFAYEPEEVVYITAVELMSKSNSISDHSVAFSLPATLSSVAYVEQSNTSITYKITVYNNTDVTQWYLGVATSSGAPSNALLGQNGGVTLTSKDKLQDTSASFNKEDWVPPRTTRDFYVTFSFGNNAKGSIALLVDFKFGMQIASMQDGFLEVLNDKISLYGYSYLSDAFDKQYAENGSTVIGNVGEDKAIFDNVFGGDLTVNVDGVEKPVTILIERKNVDGETTGDAYAGGGPSGCEYTLYVTVDALNSPTGKAEVYAISYSCRDNGEWYQIGEVYKGTATQQDYDTSNNTYDGAFNVSTWKADPATHTLGGSIEYKVGQTQHGTQYDKLSTITEIMSTKDQEIYNKIDNSGILKKAYDILKANVGSETPEIVNLRHAFEAIEPHCNNYNNGQQFQMKRDCTRAEILPYVAALCDALDYYTQVHG